MLFRSGGSSSSSSSSSSSRGGAVELLEGSSVEAFYKGKKWYPGKISRVRLNGTFDINYDDGEKEIGVVRENVRGVESERRGLSPRADRDRDAASNRIEDGSKVEGNYRGKGKWYPGKITRDRRDGTFDISYEDGESETRVEESMIRLIGGASSSRFRDDEVSNEKLLEGAKVEAKYKGKDKLYKGRISRVRLNGTYDVEYEDGEKEIGVARSLIFPIGSSGGDRGTSRESGRIEEGSKVEGNYRGKGKWYAGKITRDRGDRTFDIAYDDGESETRVDELSIRLIGGSSSSGSSSRAALEMVSTPPRSRYSEQQSFIHQSKSPQKSYASADID